MLGCEADGVPGMGGVGVEGDNPLAAGTNSIMPAARGFTMNAPSFLGLILEGQGHPGPIGHDFSPVDLGVKLLHLGDTQITQGL